jgi:hypothetical protein
LTLSEEDLQNIEESIDGFANMSARRKRLKRGVDMPGSVPAFHNTDDDSLNAISQV